jgi:predicted RNA-binding Zn-ribbon protein involved in translation (DUF1610 family)
MQEKLLKEEISCPKCGEKITIRKWDNKRKCWITVKESDR